MSGQSCDDRCPLCGGTKKPGRATFTTDFGFGVVVVRNVPALVCDPCGEQWVDDSVAEKLEVIVADARSRRQQIAVVAM